MQNDQVFTPLTDVSSPVFKADPQASGTAHSDTNVQVEGVDEGDSVKTDGRYIYTMSNGKVHIIDAYPPANMAISASLAFDNNFSPVELYVNGDQLIVVGSDWQASPDAGNPPVVPQGAQAKLAIWGGWGESRTLVKIYDLTDHTNPALLREIAVTGNYLSSRKIGNDIYLVGRKYPNYYFRFYAEPATASAGKLAMTPENTLPSVSDTEVANGAPQLLPVTDLYYFPGFVEPDYVIVAGIKLNALDQAADVKAYLGGGDTVYASSSHLYLSAADYSNNNPAPGQSVSAPFTHLYKFALAQGRVTFDGAGEVDGTPLNQFSMDEHNGYFRIATTVDQWTQTGDTGISQTWNNLYTLDSNMNVVGRLEHLADGERIYSARFIGHRSYLVTFKQVDPLFVIDLSVPQAPTVLGELKMPGFSNYLHPFDENHLIGFGQDTEDVATGTVTSGLKLALFDVTDVAHPAQLHSLTIGAQGTYSPLLYDHKALLFDKSRSLLGFPISITAQKPGDEWPIEIFQGAQVYKVSLANGFQKQAEISHQSTGNNYDWYSYVNRLLTIGDQLYTLSEAHLQANDLASYALTGFLDFPIEQPPVVCAEAASNGAASSAGGTAVDCPILIDPIVTPLAK